MTTHLTPLAVRRTWHVAAVLALSIVASQAGCRKAADEDATPVMTVDVAPVLLSEIDRTIRADGTLYPRQQAAIVPKITSPIRHLRVQRGARVKAGQLLAELEDRDLSGVAAENRAALAAAEAAFETTVRATAPEELRRRITEEAVIEVGIIAAWATFFSSFSTPFLSALFTVGMLFIGRNTDMLAKLPAKYFPPAITETGKLTPRRISGTCAKHQRPLSLEIIDRLGVLLDKRKKHEHTLDDFRTGFFGGRTIYWVESRGRLVAGPITAVGYEAPIEAARAFSRERTTMSGDDLPAPWTLAEAVAAAADPRLRLWTPVPADSQDGGRSAGRTGSALGPRPDSVRSNRLRAAHARVRPSIAFGRRIRVPHGGCAHGPIE